MTPADVCLPDPAIRAIPVLFFGDPAPAAIGAVPITAPAIHGGTGLRTAVDRVLATGRASYRGVLLALAVAAAARKGGGLPTFLIGFVACVLLNSTGAVPPAVQAAATTASQWLLTVAIALGVRTSIKSMLDLGPCHLVLVIAETLFLLGAAVLIVRFIL